MADPRRPTPPLERQLVLFGVGAVLYGLPIQRVREVVNPLPTVPLPAAPAVVLGVTDHRGEVVPVLDLRSHFGLPKLSDVTAQKRVKWILVDVAEQPPSHLVAVVVDVVHDVFRTREPLRPPPQLGGGEATRGIVGVLSRKPGDRESSLVFVLEFERLRTLIAPLLTNGSLQGASS